MRLIGKKVLAAALALALVFTVLPVQTDAAAKPKFKKSYTALYENKSNDGVYTYTVKNLTKGQKVKWSLSGTGKSYVKLSKKTTKVSGSTASVKLTVNTNEKTAAKNKTVKLTAKVYSKAGKLLYTVKSKTAKLKVLATDIEVAEDALESTKFYVGSTYQFQYRITPANATSKNTWTATDARGNAVTTMTENGQFTPDAEGTYTVTVQAAVGSKVVASGSTKITVLTAMTGVRQTAANQFVATYSGSAKDLVTKSSFTIKTAAGAKVEIKSIEFSSDGTDVTLTTYDMLQNGVSYTVSDGQSSYNVAVSVGKPVSLVILTEQVTVKKETPIEYALYDANGIDVQAAYPGTITYEETITNGYRTTDNKLYMTTVGATGTLTLTYRCTADSSITLVGTGTVVCVPASTSANTNLTLTDSQATPSYAKTGYADNRSISSGSNYYVHFRALDEDGAEINYESVKFESSDPDTLVVNSTGSSTAKVTAVKTGTVSIIVTAVYGGQTYTYVYEVTITEPAYLAALSADQSVIYMSNTTMASDYKGYINITGTDQYGKSIDLSGETAQITETGTVKAALASYDTANNRVEISASGKTAATYYYTLSITMGGVTKALSFTVVVQTPPSNGAVTYKVETSPATLDLAVTSGASTSDVETQKTISIRLAEYHGGVFYQYATFTSAKITMGGKYYTTDLTAGGTTTAPTTTYGGSVLSIKTVTVSSNTITKASTGTYKVELQYASSSSTATQTSATSFTLTDSQETPQISVDRTVSASTCGTALALAQSCLSVQGTGGTITACTVTGSDTTGSEYKIASGDYVNISSVVVQVTTALTDGTSVVSNYTLSVGKTLRNA